MPTKSKEEIQKSIDALVAKAVEKEATPAVEAPAAAPAEAAPAADLNKAMPASTPANGGKDEFKSGSPGSEAQNASAKKDVKKAEDDESEEDDDKEKDKKKAKMKKSIDELSEILDEDELELVKAWRADQEAEASAPAPTPAAPSAEEITKAVASALNPQIENLKKSIDQKDDLIKSLNDKIDKMSAQPAYSKRSVSSLETLEKGGGEQPTISKSQVLDTMLKMQVDGKGINSVHVAEMEATGNISDPRIKQLVMNEVQKGK